MTDSSEISRRRIPSVAALLSLVMPGVGHVYAGREQRGMVILLLTMFVPVALFLLAVAPPSRVVLFAIGGFLIFALCLYVFAIIDAYRVALKARSASSVGPYQRPAVYATLLLLGLSWCVGGHLLVRSHALQAYVVPTSSMKPSIQSMDRILVSTWGAPEASRGDIIIFRPPHEPYRYFIKRVTAVAGDEVRGETLPPGTIWVEGDNRSHSLDSRKFGAVPMASVVGRAVYRFWSKGGIQLDVLKPHVPRPATPSR